MLNLVHEMDAKGASLRVLEPEVTTAGDMGRMVITVLGMVADMELKFIRDRQRAGIDAAKGKGVYKGRRKSVDDEEIRRLASEGVAKAQIARDLGVSRMTVYRALADTETEADLNSSCGGFDERAHTGSAKISLRAHAARKSSALPRTRFCIAEASSVIQTDIHGVLEHPSFWVDVWA